MSASPSPPSEWVLGVEMKIVAEDWSVERK